MTRIEKRVYGQKSHQNVMIFLAILLKIEEQAHQTKMSTEMLPNLPKVPNCIHVSNFSSIYTLIFTNNVYIYAC